MANWTEDQTTLALWLYRQIPFNRVASRHPLLQEYAPLIGRNPNAVKMKIGNLGALDPELRARGIVGLAGTSKTHKVIPDDSLRVVVSARVGRLPDTDAAPHDLLLRYHGQPIRLPAVFSPVPCGLFGRAPALRGGSRPSAGGRRAVRCARFRYAAGREPREYRMDAFVRLFRAGLQPRAGYLAGLQPCAAAAAPQ